MTTLQTINGPTVEPKIIKGRETCGNGHPWTPETTRWRFRDRRDRKGHQSYGWERDCLTCRQHSQGRGGSGLRSQSWLPGAVQ